MGYISTTIIGFIVLFEILVLCHGACSLSSHHDSIMADMLAGQWYCRLCGLPPIATAAQAFSCYRTIYKYLLVIYYLDIYVQYYIEIFRFNVEKFGNGKMIGAVNGMRPTGDVDDCCLQSREVFSIICLIFYVNCMFIGLDWSNLRFGCSYVA
jgi:uncharacterized protein (DUF608 family)